MCCRPRPDRAAVPPSGGVSSTPRAGPGRIKSRQKRGESVATVKSLLQRRQWSSAGLTRLSVVSRRARPTRTLPTYLPTAYTRAAPNSVPNRSDVTRALDRRSPAANRFSVRVQSGFVAGRFVAGIPLSCPRIGFRAAGTREKNRPRPWNRRGKRTNGYRVTSPRSRPETRNSLTDHR